MIIEPKNGQPYAMIHHPESGIDLPIEIFYHLCSFLDEKSKSVAVTINQLWKTAVLTSVSMEQNSHLNQALKLVFQQNPKALFTLSGISGSNLNLLRSSGKSATEKLIEHLLKLEEPALQSLMESSRTRLCPQARKPFTLARMKRNLSTDPLEQKLKNGQFAEGFKKSLEFLGAYLELMQTAHEDDILDLARFTQTPEQRNLNYQMYTESCLQRGKPEKVLKLLKELSNEDEIWAILKIIIDTDPGLIHIGIEAINSALEQSSKPFERIAKVAYKILLVDQLKKPEWRDAAYSERSKLYPTSMLESLENACQVQNRSLRKKSLDRAFKHHLGAGINLSFSEERIQELTEALMRVRIDLFKPNERHLLLNHVTAYAYNISRLGHRDQALSLLSTFFEGENLQEQIKRLDQPIEPKKLQWMQDPKIVFLLTVLVLWIALEFNSHFKG